MHRRTREATDMPCHSRARLIAIAVITTLAATSAIAAGVADSIGVVQRSRGDVQIERSGTRMSATIGDPIYKGDRVVTDADASVEVRLPGATPLRIGPNANVAVDRFASVERTRTWSVPPLLQGLASLFTGFSRHR